ncbi:hypothetical protein LguiA_000025 [Lonicera macranthoides]
MIGDGSGLHITHTGSTSFNTKFTLDNVLCVPSMKKNIAWSFSLTNENIYT